MIAALSALLTACAIGLLVLTSLIVVALIVDYRSAKRDRALRNLTDRYSESEE